MRHRVAHRKLGRVTEHRLALLRNQAQMLIRHERISTTVPKAKELRPFVERLITIAKRGLADGAETGRALHARRLVRRDLVDRDLTAKLFDTIAPRFAARAGGYTRLLRVGFRRGDSAELAQVELVGSEYTPAVEALPSADPGAKEPAKARQTVGGRLRDAARRMRGGRKGEASEMEPAAGPRAKAPATSRTPRKGASRGKKG